VGHWGGVAARGMGRGLAWPRRHVGRAGDASVRAGDRGGVGGVAGGLAPGGDAASTVAWRAAAAKSEEA